MRSKRNVVLAILGGMLLLFVFGIVYRTLRPTAVERALRELPRYPGAHELDTTSPTGPWTDYARRGNPEGEVRVVVYRLPSSASIDTVIAYYRAHKPANWRRIGPTCYARGDVRVRVLPRPRELDVVVADTGGGCA